MTGTVLAMLVAGCGELPISTHVTAPPLAVAQTAVVGDVTGAQAPAGAYIVLFRPNAGNATSLARSLIRQFGAQESYVWDGAVKGFAARNLTAENVRFLEQHPLVQLVEPDGRLHLLGQQQLPYSPPSFAFSPLWALDRIDHYGASTFDGRFDYVNTGAGVHIYIVDTGIRASHQELVGRVGAGQCFILLSFGCSPTIDQDGHGTAVASAAAGTTFGVAKQAIVHPVRVGTGTEPFWGITCSDVISALNWIVMNASYPAVVNLSIGGFPNCFAVQQAMDAAVASNILVFKAAGNDSADAFLDRANRSAGSVIVGALAHGDDRASFSNYGPLVTMMAPGLNLTLATSLSDNASSIWSGTSFSAPLAAGVAAAALQANPSLSASALRTLLWSSASPVSIASGNGVANRVLFSNFSPPPPPPPVVTLSLAGPASVRAQAACSWSVFATGGTGPYVYAWRINNVSVGSNTPDLTWTNAGSAFTVSVTVTAAGAGPGTASRNVTVAATAAICQA